MDSDGSGALDFGEFRKALDDYRVGCNGPEADQIFSIFDVNRNGVINFEEFMSTILGDFSAYRQNIVEQAFAALDSDQDGFLDFEEIKARFDPTRHPDVISGTRTVEDCRFEFLDMFTTHHNVQHGFVPDKTVSMEEFVSYHHYMSAFIDTDKQFKTMMSGVWNMDLVETTTSNIGGVQALPGGVFPVMYGKNSREQWKYDMHRSMFGQLDQTPYKQQIQDVHANRRGTAKVAVTAEMLPAGVKTWIQVEKVPTVKSIQELAPQYT
jgi:hypothetical protein